MANMNRAVVGCIVFATLLIGVLLGIVLTTYSYAEVVDRIHIQEINIDLNETEIFNLAMEYRNRIPDD